MNKRGADDSIEKKVEKLIRRINNMEKRLKKLEKSDSRTVDDEGQKKSTNKKSQGNNPRNKVEVSTSHNYLKRTINEARKRYERDHEA